MSIPNEIKPLLNQFELLKSGEINTLEYYIWKCLKPISEYTNGVLVMTITLVILMRNALLLLKN